MAFDNDKLNELHAKYIAAMKEFGRKRIAREITTENFIEELDVVLKAMKEFEDELDAQS